MMTPFHRLPVFLLRGMIMCLLLGQVWGKSDFISQFTHEDVKSLPSPIASASVSLYEYDVEMENGLAYDHLKQGFGHIIGMWDFQAYRFFLEALKLEPDSLMATSGLCLSLMANDGHFLPQNQLALKRLEELLKTDKGTEFERGFSEAVIKLALADLKGWGEKLMELTESQAEGWILPALLNAYFSKDGYTFMGEPKYYQRKAVEVLNDYSSRRPDDPAPLTLYITAQIDNPDTRATYYTEILPCARKLARIYPEYPYYHLVHAYCEMRCGDPYLAEDAYRKAEKLYTEFQEKHKIQWRNVKQLIDVKLGLASCYILQENFSKARKIADELNQIKVPKRKFTSLAEAALNWEARTLPIRIACMEGDYLKMKAEAKKIKTSLAKIPFKERALHHFMWECLEYYVYVRSALNVKATSEADKTLERFMLAGSKVLRGGNQAIMENETMYWSRGNTLLTVLENELKTRYELSESKVDKANVLTWITNAIDQQEFSRDLMAPLWFYPMETIKADYLYKIGDYKDALREYDNAYNRLPNHIPTTMGIEKCLIKLKEGRKAEHIRVILDKLEARKG